MLTCYFDIMTCYFAIISCCFLVKTCFFCVFICFSFIKSYLGTTATGSFSVLFRKGWLFSIDIEINFIKNQDRFVTLSTVEWSNR
jgi:hypothetical protein